VNGKSLSSRVETLRHGGRAPGPKEGTVVGSVRPSVRKAILPPSPLHFVSADSKGVAGAFFVSADSKRIISPVFPALRRGVRKC
jgi:hypothetical protein